MRVTNNKDEMKPAKEDQQEQPSLSTSPGPEPERGTMLGQTWRFEDEDTETLVESDHGEAQNHKRQDCHALLYLFNPCLWLCLSSQIRLDLAE
ncbi:MAG: hypothetical protein M1816_004987 [Peltula sp. TS41687]|nr:MAG: hypothetical protein M1816_004987 [Peltula sp. TS41687]